MLMDIVELDALLLDILKFNLMRIFSIVYT